APPPAMYRPRLLGQALLDALARLEAVLGEPRLLHPVETEVAGVLAAQVVAAEIPALGPAQELVGLHLALYELVLVLLVVVELEHLTALDRLVHRAHHVRVVP